MDAAWEAVSSSTRPAGALAAAENPHVRMLARRIRECAEETARPDGEISSLLEADETYACLLTAPGIGPRTASELVIGIDVSMFPYHDRLTSRCGLAPVNRRSGTSVSSVAASRRGNKRLKNLPIFSCSSPCRSGGRSGERCRRCRERGKGHGAAP